LENTLVSVLEVRAADDELIIVHRGEYEDPYGLSGDEATVVETAASSSLAEQLNIAYGRASGEVIQVVVPGTILEPDWCDDALVAFEELDVDMIALGIKAPGSPGIQYGFESDAMPQRRLTTEASKIAGPMLGGTLIRRSTLECLGGWNSKIPSDLIDFEMSLMAKVLGLHVGVVDGALIHTQEARSMVLSHYEQGRSIGQLACAFSEKSDSTITVEPLVKRLGHLASGLVNPKLAAERLGWVLGVRDRSWVEPIGKRIEMARKSLDQRKSSWEDQPAIISNPGFPGNTQDRIRKAA
jgi:hypothetical protein